MQRAYEPHGILLGVSYDGRRFAGFARQRGQRTVAEALAGAIAALDPKASAVRASSRTDSGVHALDQRVAFDPRKTISTRGWCLGLNQHLPDDVAIARVAVVEPGFDPRHYARSKTYRYRLYLRPVRSPLLSGRAWRVGYSLDLEAMRREAALLLGAHDFRAFRSSADERKDTRRTIARADVSEDERCPAGIQIIIEGDHFLHRMVRIIVGTLVDVARGHLGPGAVSRAFDSGSRQDLGMTAPAEGLYLDRVVLKNEDLSWWPPGRVD